MFPCHASNVIGTTRLGDFFQGFSDLMHICRALENENYYFRYFYGIVTLLN